MSNDTPSNNEKLIKKESIILQVAVLSPLRRCFDYLPRKEDNVNELAIYQAGQRVLVSFGHREVIGMIMDVVTKTSVAPDKLKHIIHLLDMEPILPATMQQLLRWASDYYHHPLGDVVLSTLPKWIRKGRELYVPQKLAAAVESHAEKIEYTLNAHQQQAIEKISEAATFRTFLLEGVTGSGKTEVYLQAIAKLKPEQQALVLVPEIALTPQTVQRFSARFKQMIVVMHSAMTDKERLKAWSLAYFGHAKIIIGTRSAIFTPMKYPGMIIIDEEHDTSFKQESGFRYFARDIAVMRGSIENIPVVLGSATPSLESLYNVKRQRYQLLRLPTRVGGARLPMIRLLDLRDKKLRAGMSDDLFLAIDQHLARNNQILLFLNRRGYAPTLLCHHCGWIAQCRCCDARLTLHQSPKQLYCHHCGYHQSPLKICPNCQQTELTLIGQGTERLEAVLQAHYPDKIILRVDRDTVNSKKKMHAALQKAEQHAADILIGTQMLAKGHHFPKLTLVAIVDADGGFFSSDFRGMERISQLILQVAGRAGRAEESGEVILQTYQPNHPLLIALIEKGYSEFAQQLLLERKSAHFPPYGYLALLRADSPNKTRAIQFLEQVKSLVAQHTEEVVNLFGPVPAIMERRAGRYRAQLLLQARYRKALQQFLLPLLEAIQCNPLHSKVRWSLDVDPQSLF